MAVSACFGGPLLSIFLVCKDENNAWFDLRTEISIVTVQRTLP